MNKVVRFLIVFIVFIAMMIFSRRNDSSGAVAEETILISTLEPTAVPAADHPTGRRNLVLLEFFSGL